MKYCKLWKQRLARNLIVCLATAMVASPVALSASPEKIEPLEQNLIINIDDLRGLISLDAEWVRKDLLENAFYEAARRQKFVGFELHYNDNGPKNPRDYLEFKVIHWGRSVGNMYEISVSAKYYDADGNGINLGVFRGYRSGIDVLMRRDIADHFEETAEDAFRQAIRKLKALS